MAQRGDEFWIEIQDIRHCVEDEGDTLTLLWVLEGRAELNTDAGRDILEANTLAIINRHRRWQFTSETANVTLRVTLSGRWVVQLCNDFFAHDYAVPAEAGGVWPQCDALRDSAAPASCGHPHQRPAPLPAGGVPLAERDIAVADQPLSTARPYAVPGTFLSAQQTHRPGDRADQCQLYPPYYACGNRRE